MKRRIAKLVLMLSLFLSAALCYANGMAKTKNEKKGDGTPVEVIEKAVHGGTDKSGSIVPIISGHVLSVVFTENIGSVAIEVTTNLGAPVEGISVITPTGIMFYIPLTGDYIVTFTLPNGDEYYGEFTVTD